MVYWPFRRASGKQSQSPPARPEAACTNKANSPAGVRAGLCQEAMAPNKPNLPADRPEGPRGVRRVECAKQTQFGGASRGWSRSCETKPNLGGLGHLGDGTHSETPDSAKQSQFGLPPRSAADEMRQTNPICPRRVRLYKQSPSTSRGDTLPFRRTFVRQDRSGVKVPCGPAGASQSGRAAFSG
jgi:hypothetical protein